jgi:hypothetical protein
MQTYTIMVALFLLFNYCCAIEKQVFCFDLTSASCFLMALRKYDFVSSAIIYANFFA